jgi:hypothetical protein
MEYPDLLLQRKIRFAELESFPQGGVDDSFEMLGDEFVFFHG